MATKTETTPSRYRFETGKHEKLAEKLEAMVPEQGRVENEWIELYRCFVNIYHDLYQNGGCNLDNRIYEVANIWDHWSDIKPHYVSESRDWYRFEATMKPLVRYAVKSIYNEECTLSGWNGQPTDEQHEHASSRFEDIADAIILCCAKKLGIRKRQSRESGL